MGGEGRGFKNSSRLPSSSATIMAWVRYFLGNIDYFFFLCLTLVTKRITPFFKYKLLVIFFKVKFRTTLYFLLASCRAWPVVRCGGNLALPHAGHRWWWRLRWFWGRLVNCVHTFLKTGFRALFNWVSKNQKLSYHGDLSEEGRYHKEPMRTQSYLKRGKRQWPERDWF